MCATKDQTYCPIHQVFVNIRKSFTYCITEHQCFSDDPCPLSEKFKAETVKSSAARIRSTSSAQRVDGYKVLNRVR